MHPTQAILPVAGLGTRFLPWTKAVPKEMLHIGNQPIVALLVDECLGVGIHEICFVVSKGKEAIGKYFEKDEALEAELEKRGKSQALRDLARYDNVRFHFVEQPEQLGDGDAILHAAEWATSESLAVLFGDDLIAGPRSGLQQLAAVQGLMTEGGRGNPIILCLETVPEAMVSRYGIVDADPMPTPRIHRVKSLVEKPKIEDAPGRLGIVGKYIIPRTTLDTLKKTRRADDKELRLIDALIAELRQGVHVYGCEAEGKRLDTGTPEGYKEAVRMLG